MKTMHGTRDEWTRTIDMINCVEQNNLAAHSANKESRQFQCVN